MKQKISILIALLAILLLVSCGEDDSSNPTGGSGSSSETRITRVTTEKNDEKLNYDSFGRLKKIDNEKQEITITFKYEGSSEKPQTISVKTLFDEGIMNISYDSKGRISKRTNLFNGNFQDETNFTYEGEFLVKADFRDEDDDHSIKIWTYEGNKLISYNDEAGYDNLKFNYDSSNMLSEILFYNEGSYNFIYQNDKIKSRSLKYGSQIVEKESLGFKGNCLVVDTLKRVGSNNNLQNYKITTFEYDGKWNCTKVITNHLEDNRIEVQEITYGVGHNNLEEVKKALSPESYYTAQYKFSKSIPIIYNLNFNDN